MTGPFDEAGFRELTRRITAARGFGCANYKDGCLRRRIAVRMRARGVGTYAEYRALLERDASEFELLLDALTINVTKLYRDPAVWDAVAARVLPALWAAPGPIVAWSAGCASGEEPYTLAALLHRQAERTHQLARLAEVRVIASDIDRASLDAARAAVFPPRAFGDLPAALRDRYFSPEPPHRAAEELRALVHVERRDLLSDPPPAPRLGLITCRNVVIYFDRPIQGPLVQRFHDALAPGGFLVLGKVETLLGEARRLFEVVDSSNRIFRRAAA